MKKDFAKKSKPKPPSFGRRLMVFFLCAVTTLSIFYGIDAYKNHGEGFSWISTYFSKIRRHESEKKHPLALNKKINEEKTEEKSIHFEFYTTLPNMQVSPVSIQPQPALAEKKLKDTGDLMAEEIAKELASPIKKKYKQKVSI